MQWETMSEIVVLHSFLTTKFFGNGFLFFDNCFMAVCCVSRGCLLCVSWFVHLVELARTGQKCDVCESSAADLQSPQPFSVRRKSDFEPITSV